jgi:hypothetical protein
VTICAVIQDPTGRKFIAKPAVRIHTICDTSRWSDRGANSITRMRAKALAAAQMLNSQSIPVKWYGMWIDFYGRLFRPFSSIDRP